MRIARCMLARPFLPICMEIAGGTMRGHNKKLVAFYVYHILEIPSPLKWKYTWMAEWLVGSRKFPEERQIAERIVELADKR